MGGYGRNVYANLGGKMNKWVLAEHLVSGLVISGLLLALDSHVDLKSWEFFILSFGISWFFGRVRP